MHDACSSCGYTFMFNLVRLSIAETNITKLTWDSSTIPLASCP
jgi:hypothetical protein